VPGLISADHALRDASPGGQLRLRQGEISGLSRSVSNLGSSLGTALVGSVLVAGKLPAGRPFAVALTMLLVITLIGLVLAALIPRKPTETTATPSPGTEPATSQPAP
jgi:hypothetical protein